MRYRTLLFVLVISAFFAPSLSEANTGDLGSIIESFVTRHFPDASSHVWIVNGTQWDGDEMIVDVSTVVVEHRLPAPIENRYLLLIVKGELTAAQRIPLEDGTDCQRDET